jgi:hypothetical protein
MTEPSITACASSGNEGSGDPPVALSLLSRGLRVLDVPPSTTAAARRAAATAAARDGALDIAVSIAAHVLLLPAWAWASVALLVVSVCFFAFVQDGRLAGLPTATLLLPLAAMVHLPSLWLAARVCQQPLGVRSSA